MAEQDVRIRLSHIGLFAALLQYWREQGYQTPFRVFSREIMPIAKISTRLTYCKYIRELAEFGYIWYEPSFKQNQGSLVRFLPPELL